MKIVLDTNVLISALINPHGNPAKILNLILAEKLLLLYDNRILIEYSEVLQRNKFGFSIDVIFPLLDFIKYEGLFINTEPIKKKFIDEEDKKFYEVFISGRADFLITGNLNHFPKKSSILNPTGFINIVLNI